MLAIKAKCLKCRVLDESSSRYTYYLASETDWLSPAGYDPMLRQFKCENCGDVFYKQVSEEQLLRTREAATGNKGV